jgi:hypothetical protein
MTSKFAKCSILIAAALAMGLASAAQTPPSGAALAGVVTEVTGDTVTLQGLSLSVNDKTRFAAVLADGTMGPVPFSAVQAGVPMHCRFIFVNGQPTLVLGELGADFFWHGILTAFDDATLTLDNAITIHRTQAHLVGSGSLQVGATVGVKGEVLGGVFAAKLINTSALDFAFAGSITALTQDGAGDVVGFTVAKGDQNFFVDLDGNSLVWKGRTQVSANTLAVGTRIKVDGWIQPDGSALAWNVRILPRQ